MVSPHWRTWGEPNATMSFRAQTTSRPSRRAQTLSPTARPWRSPSQQCKDTGLCGKITEEEAGSYPRPMVKQCAACKQECKDTGGLCAPLSGEARLDPLLVALDSDAQSRAYREHRKSGHAAHLIGQYYTCPLGHRTEATPAEVMRGHGTGAHAVTSEDCAA